MNGGAMAGELKVDEGGLSMLVRELQVHGTTSGDHSSDAEAALTSAASALSTPVLVGAMQRLTERFRGNADDVGLRMTSLGSSLTTAAHALLATDESLARAARRLEQ